MQNRTIPSVSVVMPAYNAEKYLREAIDSTLAQTYTDFELIIINDGSTDGTKDIILSYSDPRIVYLENEQNSGICVTLNKGLDAARGRYIARMDSDDIMMPRRLAIQVEYMDSHPEIGVCGSDIEIFYTDGTTPNRKFEFDTNPLVCKANLIFSATCAHPAVIIRKSVIDDYHIRYDDFYRGMEDHNLWWRISKVAQISNISEVLLKYRQHPSQVTKQNNDPAFKSRLRAFIRQRIYDYGAVLTNEELSSFYLYHEDVESFDDISLKRFINACGKILKRQRSNRLEFVSAQKLVFSKAISYILDRSRFSRYKAIKFQYLAVVSGAMRLNWFIKRMGSNCKHLCISSGKHTPFRNSGGG